MTWISEDTDKQSTDNLDSTQILKQGKGQLIRIPS